MLEPFFLQKLAETVPVKRNAAFFCLPLDNDSDFTLDNWRLNLLALEKNSSWSFYPSEPYLEMRDSAWKLIPEQEKENYLIVEPEGGVPSTSWTPKSVHFWADFSKTVAPTFRLEIPSTKSGSLLFLVYKLDPHTQLTIKS